MLNLFQSATDPEVFGFTQDATGQNLPEKFAPWHKSSHSGSLYLGIGESSAQLAADDPVIRAVQTRGFYLVGAPQSPANRWKQRWRTPA